MTPSKIIAIAFHTFKDAIRAKWLIIFAVVFFFIAVNIPLLVLIAARLISPNYLDVFLSNLITVSFPFLPLLALPMGATSIVDERESGVLQYVLSTPISRGEFLVGRMLGLLLATTAVIMLGYGVASLLTFSLNLTRYSSLGLVMLIGVLLNAVMLSFALVISVLTRRKTTALGLAILSWFLFTTVSNLGFLTSFISLALGPSSTLPFILLNPVESSRVLAQIQLNPGAPDIGNTKLVTYVLGSNSSAVLIASMLAWIGISFNVAYTLFLRKDAV